VLNIGLHGQHLHRGRPWREGSAPCGTRSRDNGCPRGRTPLSGCWTCSRPSRRGFGRRHVQLRPNVDPGRGSAPSAHGIRSVYLQAGPGRAGAGRVGGESPRGRGGISRAVGLPGDRPRRGRRNGIRDPPAVSRLGKTVMWAGAGRPRDRGGHRELVGRGRRGAQPPQLRRDRLPTSSRRRPLPYQFRRRTTRGGLPIPAGLRPSTPNLLVALIAAAGALLLQNGADTDTWSDPKGEFLAANCRRGRCSSCSASTGRPPTRSRPAGEIVGDTLAFYMHSRRARDGAGRLGGLPWISSRSSSNRPGDAAAPPPRVLSTAGWRVHPRDAQDRADGDRPVSVTGESP